MTVKAGDTQTQSSAKTLAIGAYERENFGDLLFLHVTAALLGDGSEISAGTPFAPSRSSLGERTMVRYSDELAARSYDRVWVVGGEVGGARMSSAFGMSAEDSEHQAYLAASRADRRKQLEAAAGQRWFTAPYMPHLPGFQGVYVINSVGLYGIGGLRGRELWSAYKALHRADYVSVRERYSHRLLTAMGIRHRVAPDMVHAIRATGLIRAERRQPVVLVQVREESLREFGAERVAHVLTKSPAIAHLGIRLFRAGSARGHDSLELYERIADRIRRIDPGRPVSISDASTSIEKATEIAGASLWVGTSLHGNIVSTAFGVPRVGLANRKVDRYCATWGDPMPFATQIRDLDSAAETALRTASLAKVAAYTESMSARALENFRLAAAASRGT